MIVQVAFNYCFRIVTNYFCESIGNNKVSNKAVVVYCKPDLGHVPT